MRKLIFGSERDKLLFAFQLHDDDGDGFIGPTELFRMIALGLAEDDVVTRSGRAAPPFAPALRDGGPES